MISLILPVLNEEGGLKWFLPEVDKIRASSLYSIEIIVIDGGNSPLTREICREHDVRYVLQETRGIPDACNLGYAASCGDIIVEASPDGNCTPEDIWRLAEVVVKGGADMAIGSRYAGDAVSFDDDCITAFGNWFFTWLINGLFHAQYTDSLTLFRAYSKDAIEKMRLTEVTPAGKFHYMCEGWEVRSSIRAAKMRLKVVEMASTENKRTSGKRKMKPLRNGLAALVQIGYELWRQP